MSTFEGPTRVFSAAVLIVVLGGCDGNQTTAPSDLDDRRWIPEGGERYAMVLDSTIVWSDPGTAKDIHRAHDVLQQPSLVSGNEPLMKDSLSVLRARLADASRLGGDGSLSFALLFQVADVWAADSPAAVRAALAKLPVQVVASSVDGADGRKHQRRDYFVHGRLKLSLFLSSASAEEGARTVIVPDEPWCETEFQGTLYVDVCATQQDLDDAAITLAALEYEVDGYEAAYEAGVRQVCGEIPDPTCLPPVESLIQYPSMGCSTSGPAAAPGQCAGEAIAFLGAVANWALNKDATYGMMMRGASITARRALLAGVGGTVLAAFGAGYAIGTFLGCIEALT